MIKLHYTPIRGLVKLCFLAIAMLIVNTSSAQIVINWPDFLNNNSGGPIFYNQSTTLTGCTSISFSMQYTSNDWQPNGGVLEDAAFCSGCSGDPADANTPECDFCWDFLDFDLLINGSVELEQLVGTTYLITSELFTWDSGCIDPEDSYDIELDVVSATWQNLENIDLTNIMIICNQGVAEDDLTIDPGDELCEGDDLDLEVSSNFTDAEWFFDGSNIASGTNVSFTDVTTDESGTYTVETTDVNGCISSVEFDIEVEEIPMSCPVTSPVEACIGGSGFAEIDLTVFDGEVSCFVGSDDVLWFTDFGDIPDSPIIDPENFESDGSDLYAVVFNGLCYSEEQLVFVDTGSGVDATIITSDVCEGENLIFEVTTTPTCLSCTYTWDGPAGSGITDDDTPSEIFQVLNASSAFSGMWTVTVTDDTGCSGSTSVDVVVTDAPTGSISGGGDLCPGFCTDASNELTLDLNGGTPPYDVTLQISVGFLNIEQDIPAFLPNGTISLCIDPSSLLPSFSDFDGDGVDDLVIPNIALDFSVSLLGIEDDTGCEGTGSGTINYTINPVPNANDPGGPFELCGGMPFDLTSFDDNINGSQPILWFEDMDLTSQIGSPDAYVPSALPTTVFAVVDNGTCLSPPVSLELMEIPQPVLDPIDDVTVCEVYDFIQPFGSNLGNNVFYEDSEGNTFIPGNITTESGTYTAIAGDDPACIAMETFQVTILNLPDIVFPTSDISACGEIILPSIDVLNFDVSTGTVGYFEQEGQAGVMYSEGDIIDQTSGLTSIFVYVGSPGCFDEVEINLIFSSDIEYILPAYPDEACGDFELLPIGGSTPGVAYFTEEDGAGTEYGVGDILQAPGTYTLFVYDPDIDQACVLNANESFTIALEEEPFIDPIADVTVCEADGFVLPTITGEFLTGDEGYATETNGGGTTYQAGDTIFTAGTIFLFNTAASCPATEVVFELTVEPAPNAGADGSFETCIGPVIDLTTLLSLGADPGGVFISVDPTISLSGADNTLWDTSTADTDTPYVFTYGVPSITGICDDGISEITIVLTNDVSAGVALPDSSICSGEVIDLFGLIDGESSGGFFIDQSNILDTIFDGSWIAEGTNTTFSYIIEEADGCNGDQSSFDVLVVESQELTVEIPITEVCQASCIEMIFNSNFLAELDLQLIDMDNGGVVHDISIASEDTEVFLLCAEGTTGELNGNVISLGEDGGDFVVAFAFLQNAGDCETNFNSLNDFEIEYIPSFEETIEGQVCEGEAFEYNGVMFFEGETVMNELSMAGCDSTTIVNVSDYPPAENFENGTFCIGTDVEIGGEIFTQDTQTQLILEDASANGCDSTIFIDIAFDNASFNNIMETICMNDEIEVNGVVYDFDNPNGADTLFNGSVQGCDSIITVALDFYDLAVGEEMETICQGDTINILGVDFYSGMEQMEITLENESINGCDSTVNVMIDFFPAMQLTEEYEKCEGETLIVNDFEITDDNLSGIYTLTGSGSDCPTVINYTTILFSSTMIEIDTTICQGESIEINGITFDANNTFDESIGQTANGCDSTIVISVNIEDGSVGVMSQVVGINEHLLSYDENNIIDPVWSSNLGTLSCEACESPMIAIQEDTEVYLSAMRDNGCLVADTIVISFIPEPAFVGIYTPNVFTPDDDNLNNIYTIYGTGGFVINEMTIYDRWGNQVYSAGEFLPNEELVGWDGRIDGVKAMVGVYVGRIVYEEPDGTENILVFDLTLLR